MLFDKIALLEQLGKLLLQKCQFITIAPAQHPSRAVVDPVSVILHMANQRTFQLSVDRQRPLETAKRIHILHTRQIEALPKQSMQNICERRIRFYLDLVQQRISLRWIVKYLFAHRIDSQID